MMPEDIVNAEKDCSAFPKESVNAKENRSVFRKESVNAKENRSVFRKESVNAKENRSVFRKESVNAKENHSVCRKEAVNADPEGGGRKIRNDFENAEKKGEDRRKDFPNMEDGAKRERVVFLDFLRLIAFVLIILYHFMIELEIREIYDFSRTPLWYENANMHIATFGVALFFMISGASLMLSAQKKFDWKAYYRKRFVRILIPFYLVYLVTACFLLLRFRVTPFSENAKPWTIVLTLLGMDQYAATWGIPAYNLGIGEWFLGALVMIYLIYPVLRLLMLRRPHLLMMAATVFYIVFVIFYPFETAPYLNVFVKLYEFLWGMYLMHLAENGRLRQAFGAGIDKSGGYWKFFFHMRKEGKASDAEKPESAHNQKMNRLRYVAVLLPAAVTALFVFCPIEIPIPNTFRITMLALSVFGLFMQGEDLFERIGKLPGLLKTAAGISFEIYLVHHVLIQQIDYSFTGTVIGGKAVLLLFVTEIAGMIFFGVLLKRAEERISQIPKWWKAL